MPRRRREPSPSSSSDSSASEDDGPPQAPSLITQQEIGGYKLLVLGARPCRRYDEWCGLDSKSLLFPARYHVIANIHTQNTVKWYPTQGMEVFSPRATSPTGARQNHSDVPSPIVVKPVSIFTKSVVISEYVLHFQPQLTPVICAYPTRDEV